MFGIGIWAVVENQDFEFITGNAIASGGGILIVAGIVTMGVCVVGIVGAIFKARPLLVVVSYYHIHPVHVHVTCTAVHVTHIHPVHVHVIHIHPVQVTITPPALCRTHELCCLTSSYFSSWVWSSNQSIILCLVCMPAI